MAIGETLPSLRLWDDVQSGLSYAKMGKYSKDCKSRDD